MAINLQTRDIIPPYVGLGGDKPLSQRITKEQIDATIIRPGASVSNDLQPILTKYGQTIQTEYHLNGTAHFSDCRRALGFSSDHTDTVPEDISYIVTYQGINMLTGIRLVTHPDNKGLGGSFPVVATDLHDNILRLYGMDIEEATSKEFFGEVNSYSEKGARWIVRAVKKSILHFNPGYVEWLISKNSRGLTGFELTRFVKNPMESQSIIQKAVKTGLPLLHKEAEDVETINSISVLAFVPHFIQYMNAAFNGVLGTLNHMTDGAIGRAIEPKWRFDIIPISSKWSRSPVATEELAAEYFNDKALAVLIASRTELANYYQNISK